MAQVIVSESENAFQSVFTGCVSYGAVCAFGDYTGGLFNKREIFLAAFTAENSVI
jgi:hypothetical protein